MPGPRLAWAFITLIVLTSVAPGQQPGVAVQAPGKPAIDDGGPQGFAGRRPVDGPWYANHEMRLRSDGNLPGQLRAFDSAGNLTPVRARLFFIQNGQIIGRATADESGRFQVVGLDSGAYSVVAAGPEGFGAFSLHVVKPNQGVPNVVPPKVKSIGKYKEVSEVKAVADADEQMAAEPLLLDVSLIPPTDFPMISQIIRDQVPGLSLPGGGAAAGPLGAASAGAGIGGGGGGGLGSALGMGAALGGVGALIGAHSQSTASDSTGT